MKSLQAFFITAFVCICFCANAQQKEKKETSLFSFSSINNIGLLLGDNEHEFSLQSINGVQHKSWFAGVGVGIDNYYLRSVPVFLDVRKMVRPGIWPLFVYGDVGLNIAWLKDSDKEGFWYNSKMKNGLYYDVGAGLNFPLKRGAILISGGYSSKQTDEVRTYSYIWGPPGVADKKDYVDYHFSRLVIKAGFQF